MNTKQLRQKILDLAIRGKLVPQDPNDEPASVLLERVRAEKERLIKEGKIKRGKGDVAPLSVSDKLHYGQLPPGWVLVRLGEICDSVLGKMLDAEKNKGEYRPYLRNLNVRWGSFDLSDLLEMRFEDNEYDRYRVMPGDLIVCEGGEPGRCAVWKNCEIDIWFQKALHRIRPFAGIIADYLYLLIWKLAQNDELETYFTGSTIKHLTGQSLSMLPIPLPPVSEQARIVASVGSAFAIIDQIEQSKLDLQIAVATIKRKILSLAISGKLVPQDPDDEPAAALLERIRAERTQKEGKQGRKGASAALRCDDNSYYEKVPFALPKSWVWYRLSDYWDLLSGRDLSPAEYSDNEPGIPYITGASNFTEKGLIINRWTGYPKVIAQDGDLLITCKGTVGTMCINSQGNLHIARQVMAIRNCNGLDVAFLKLVLTHSIEKIISTAKGIIPGITRDDLLDMLIPCPPLCEQKRITSAVATAFEQIDQIEVNIS